MKNKLGISLTTDEEVRLTVQIASAMVEAGEDYSQQEVRNGNAKYIAREAYAVLNAIVDHINEGRE